MLRRRLAKRTVDLGNNTAASIKTKLSTIIGNFSFLQTKHISTLLFKAKDISYENKDIIQTQKQYNKVGKDWSKAICCSMDQLARKG